MSNQEEGRTLVARLTANTRVVNIIVAGCVVALGLLYIAQVNASASKALTMRRLEDTNYALRLESERLTAKIDDLRSLDSVMQRQQFLGLVKASAVSYVTMGTDSVALRN